MFFLVGIVFITQMILLFFLASALLTLDVKILLLNDYVDDYNTWLSLRKSSIIKIFADVKFLVKKMQDKIHNKERKIIKNQMIATIEWLLLFIAKKRQKQLILCYKFAKKIFSKLSMFKNMV